MHAPSVLCRPRGQAADVCTNANTYTRGVEPLCSPCPTRVRTPARVRLCLLAERVHTPSRTRARERARQRGHPSPCRCVAPLRRATPSLTAQRACRPYHALVLVGPAVDALFACWHFHLSFRRLAGALSAAGDLRFPSDPRPCRDCVAVLLAHAVVAEPPALTRTNPTVAFPTSSETKASRSRPPRLSTSLPRTPFRPPGRTSVRPSQCMCSSTRPHAGEHPGVPPGSSPFCAQTSCELKPSPSTFPSSPGKPRS
jgi:hypothetical protein